MKFWCVTCICIFGILQIVHTSSDQNFNRIEKLCDKIVRSRETERVPYLETYKLDITNRFHTYQDRWNYKTEYHTVTRKEKVCCNGYKETNDSMCEPICDLPCENGVCMLPQTCTCNIGYTVEYYDNYTLHCAPVCTRNCLYGKCTAPEVCTCDHGYSLNNDSICAPICTSPCGKGLHCVKPDYCDCLPGYDEVNMTDTHLPSSIKNHTTKICKPMCNEKCVNGECDDYNTCVCHDGYELDPDNIFVCKPKCIHGCAFGTCTAPNKCTCDKGYMINTLGSCDPICKEHCTNGFCAAPDICECFKGYGLRENSKYICEPICNLCINGKCIAPNQCECNEGHQAHDFFEGVCKAICKPACEPFGLCSYPNKCDCHTGYRLRSNETQTKEIVSNDTNTNWACEPICYPECINGFCKEHNYCQCNEGYRFAKNYFFSLIHRNRCEPICNPSCKNGICIKPNVCSCNLGYRLTANSTNKCEPICDPVCKTNEICVAHNVCACKDKYHMIHNPHKAIQFECLPTCKVDCGNGTCTAPDLCECFPGYRNTKAGGCEPVCKMCNNGICVAPEVCKCHHGWTGVYCDQHTVCILILNNDENRARTLKIIDKQNSAIKNVLTNNPKCPECINKLNNEISCFKMYINDMNSTAQIGCIMDRECSELWSQYGNQKAITPIAIYLGILVLILGTLATYILLRKCRNYRLRALDAGDIQNTSMQGLIKREN